MTQLRSPEIELSEEDLTDAAVILNVARQCFADSERRPSQARKLLRMVVSIYWDGPRDTKQGRRYFPGFAVWSPAARARAAEGSKGLIGEHVIPVKVLSKQVYALVSNPDATPAEMARFLRSSTFAVITKEEDKLLNSMGAAPVDAA
jgi:hypothetical protein